MIVNFIRAFTPALLYKTKWYRGHDTTLVSHLLDRTYLWHSIIKTKWHHNDPMMLVTFIHAFIAISNWMASWPRCDADPSTSDQLSVPCPYTSRAETEHFAVSCSFLEKALAVKDPVALFQAQELAWPTIS